MIKRISKATSLLVAAAAVVSLIPAVGANAATKQLETKSGTIEKAIAFEGGKYIFEGYRTSDDQNGLYYNAGDKDKLIEDINVDSMDKYGSKYATVKDGSDEYLVDLSTGNVEEDTASDDQIYLETKLKSTLSKTDRYETISGFASFAQIEGSQFGDTWYSYSATTSSAGTLNGYVNSAGKYIDTDVTANMYVSTGTKTVKVEKFNEANSGSNIVLTISSVKELAQDKDYIYRLVNVNVANSPTGVTTASYVQKISKAQGTQKDKAYLPDSVTSYEVSSLYKADGSADAYAAINDTDTTFRVINGVIYAVKNDGSKVTVNTIKLKKDKTALKTDTADTNKLDVYLAEKDVKEDQDIAGTAAVSIDVDGNVWALNKGTIYKFDGTNFNAVYGVDRSFDTLEVYNANSLLAWEAGSDGYSAVAGSDTQTPPVENPVQNKGWVKTDAGWTFYNTDGSQAKGKWVNDNGTWYMIKADGIMVTGWYNDNGTWYYLQSSGAMKTGWLNDNGTWYYLQSSGAMKTGWLKDTDGNWYYLQSNGAMKTGWFKDTDGNWYYLQSSGAMAANTTIEGYRLNASGAWVR